MFDLRVTYMQFGILKEMTILNTYWANVYTEINSRGISEQDVIKIERLAEPVAF